VGGAGERPVWGIGERSTAEANGWGHAVTQVAGRADGELFFIQHRIENKSKEIARDLRKI
jgi:hypothetical protein